MNIDLFNKFNPEVYISTYNPSEICQIGLDVGSTTIKMVVLDAGGKIIYSKYARHFSNPRPGAHQLFKQLQTIVGNHLCSLCITGSGGISIAQEMKAPFVQEVLACQLALAQEFPDADIALELGGEDAKLTYLTGGLEQRMNETCAGGTGAFIDQMAAFLGVDAAGLNKLAEKGATIYPIASRCGVFAKTDILPLLNEGCSREDLALSIMQAVVAQTISGLAQGRPIKGKTVFLGGPLYFLSALRKRFLASLPQVTETILPDNAHFFVAFGAALHARQNEYFSMDNALTVLQHPSPANNSPYLPPLFQDHAEWDEFVKRHAQTTVRTAALEEASGDAWLGFDCGSTTLKSCLIDASGRILHSSYQSSKGNPLAQAIQTLRFLLEHLPPNLRITGSCATGYGSAMLCAALGIDLDEVETVAHCAAATFFEPDVNLILDIGGQDIKCMQVRNGVIEKISLNEACSAGCGSFIENFAESLNMDLSSFVQAALFAKMPADLGTRCTVFMNSKVKQAQKEGVPLDGIAAGLSYSVIRNALYKVMKIADPKLPGRLVVAQGGAFLNDALLRALELELNAQVKRPAIAGLMGAFGAALVARKRLRNRISKLLTLEELRDFSTKTTFARCNKCANCCKLTISKFGGGRSFVSGNRCERGNSREKQILPNLYEWKYRRLFNHYQPLNGEAAFRGVIGLPRALNMYENYPLWFTIFTRLGYRVELSDPSSKEIYFSGFDTIPSQTVCYPAKLAHGHVCNLISKGIKTIFYPCVSREQNDAEFKHGIYNCPVVAGYPELLATNIQALVAKGINLIHNFLPLDKKLLPLRLKEIPFFSEIALTEIKEAVAAGFAEIAQFRQELREAGDKALAELSASGKMGIILAGHPYHIDPEIHHGIAELINSCGLGVLTEDSVIHHMPDPGPLRVVDQWAYHSRLYRAGAFAGRMDNLAVLQLVSFGCGLDAVTSDQLEEIVTRNGKLYAQIKIDEGQSLGPARIRIRSLLAAMREKSEAAHKPVCDTTRQDLIYPAFTSDMRQTHTLLVPQMSPCHFQFAREIFACEGYTAELLPTVSKKALETGLRHVNNDACFPAIIVIGQLLEAVKNGQYDPDKVALVISQTGGCCRATNYVAFLRKALNDAGLENVPIVNFSTSFAGPGIRLSEPLMRRLIMAGHYGDAFLRISHRLRPYEKEKGSTENLVSEWTKIAAKNIESGNCARFHYNILKMIREFDRLPILNEPRRERVGLVGEILLKYHPYANNEAVKIIEEEGGEAVSTDIIDFLLYSMHDHIYSYQHLAGSKKAFLQAKMAIAFLEFTRMPLRLGFGMSKRFNRPSRFKEIRRMGRKIMSLGFHAGEGWLLGSEMVRMLESGITKILCMQPFGCLPNHIAGKGLIRELKRQYPHATITPLDYDASTSEVNQINRIKLMMRNN